MSTRPQARSEPSGINRAIHRNDNESLASRLGILALTLQVERTEQLTPSFRRIVLFGEDLSRMDPFPGQDLMIAIDDDGSRVRRRRYTIRSFDPRRRRVTLDVAIHGDGPGMRWAVSAKPGQTIEAVGPRGKIGLDPDARWHLFVGDDAFAPAALVMAEAVQPDQLVLLAIEVDGPGHEHPANIRARVSGPEWLNRGDRALGDPTQLLDALEVLQLPSGPGHAYVGGEHGMVNAVKDTLVAKGMDNEAISAKSYWRLGRQNAPNGEPERA